MAIKFKIGGHWIGNSKPCFIIAEAGVNHNGKLNLAKKLIATAKKAGADAVKFQTFVSKDLVSETAQKAEYQKANDRRHETQFEMLKSLELTPKQFMDLKTYCKKLDILFLSTPFDLASVELLEKLGISAYKIPSGEITNLQLLRHVARKGKPIILSTGMAGISEIARALKVIYSTGNKRVAILQCTTSYPAPPNTLNLRTIPVLTKKFRMPVGFSDHSEGIVAPVVAVSLGACIIEKHFTLARTLPGPDHKASIEPKELKAMVDAIRTTEQMLGEGLKKKQEIEKEISPHIRKGLYAKTTIKKGEKLTSRNITAKRPVKGLPAEKFDWVLGRHMNINLAEGEPIYLADIKLSKKVNT
ncbi:MAG: N-acetylneuraminate synthase [Candidatus Micrarchaeia archaeon]